MDCKSPVVHVVDDDAEMRQSIECLAKTVGLAVKTHSSASDFIATLNVERVGCVVTDVRMPTISGIQLQERINRVAPMIPVIFLTAYADVNLAVRAMKNGAFEFLEKPVGGQVLLDTIHHAIQEHDKRQRSTADTHHVMQCFDQLTSREMEVLELVVEGLSSKEIGGQLGVSFKTIEAHRSKIMKKTEADSLPHLIRMRVQLQRHIAQSNFAGRVD